MSASLHVGKKAPKGFVELPGAIHLGRGLWLMRIRPMNAKERGIELGKRAVRTATKAVSR